MPGIRSALIDTLFCVSLGISVGLALAEYKIAGACADNSRATLQTRDVTIQCEVVPTA